MKTEKRIIKYWVHIPGDIVEERYAVCPVGYTETGKIATIEFSSWCGDYCSIEELAIEFDLSDIINLPVIDLNETGYWKHKRMRK